MARRPRCRFVLSVAAGRLLCLCTAPGLRRRAKLFEKAEMRSVLGVKSPRKRPTPRLETLTVNFWPPVSHDDRLELMCGCDTCRGSSGNDFHHICILSWARSCDPYAKRSSARLLGCISPPSASSTWTGASGAQREDHRHGCEEEGDHFGPDSLLYSDPERAMQYVLLF